MAYALAADQTDRRFSDRESVMCHSTMRGADGVRHNIVVHDLSATGVAFVCDAALTIGSEVTIGLSGGGAAVGEIVRCDGNVFGCVFRTPLSISQLVEAFSSPGVLLGDFGKEIPRAAQATLREWSGRRRALTAFTLASASWAIFGFAIKSAI